MSKENDFSINRDRYSERREGKSVIYEISCANCQTPIMLYQKDGKGNLIRCYLDRIYEIKNVEGLDQEDSDPNLSKLRNITCGNCHTLIGTSMIYKPEKRPAFRMRKGTYSRTPYKPPKS